MYNIHPEFQRVKRKETTCCCWIYPTKDSGNTAVRKYIIQLKNLTLFHILFAQSCKKKKEKKKGETVKNCLKRQDVKLCCGGLCVPTMRERRGELKPVSSLL